MPYNNKRSEEAKLRREQRRETKKSLRTQANTFIQDNSFKDTTNGEIVNQLTPENVKDYILRVNEGVAVRVVREAMFGSLISSSEGFLAQAAQGLVLENGIKY